MRIHYEEDLYLTLMPREVARLFAIRQRTDRPVQLLGHPRRLQILRRIVGDGCAS